MCLGVGLYWGPDPGFRDQLGGRAHTRRDGEAGTVTGQERVDVRPTHVRLGSGPPVRYTGVGSWTTRSGTEVSEGSGSETQVERQGKPTLPRGGGGGSRVGEVTRGPSGDSGSEGSTPSRPNSGKPVGTDWSRYHTVSTPVSTPYPHPWSIHTEPTCDASVEEGPRTETDRGQSWGYGSQGGDGSSHLLLRQSSDPGPLRPSAPPLPSGVLRFYRDNPRRLERR